MNNSNRLLTSTRSAITGIFSRVLILVGCLAFSQAILALDPPPGGGYPGEITALGQDALFSQPPGNFVDNTAIGYQALYSNTTGGSNTAVGDSALHDNTTGD